jgi:2'-5' RNA ligase
MRLFFALPVPPDIGLLLGKAGMSLKQRYLGLSVPREEGMHFTLFFFGETDKEGAAGLSRILEAPELNRPPIRARFSSVGTFPSEGNPRVIFAAADEGAADIVAVYDCLLGLLRARSWPLQEENRPFHPHVTIARNKRDRLDRRDLAGVPLPTEPFLIDRCVLFESVLKPDGAAYTPLKERVFGK